MGLGSFWAGNRGGDAGRGVLASFRQNGCGLSSVECGGWRVWYRGRGEGGVGGMDYRSCLFFGGGGDGEVAEVWYCGATDCLAWGWERGGGGGCAALGAAVGGGAKVVAAAGAASCAFALARATDAN